MERLLGAGRLLSKMVEPMLKAAVEISTLLARSFFVGLSLMILALLARLRVLVQQMLLDVVLVFNEVSSIAREKQSIKITHNGVEVFREYYPAMREAVTLDCVWKTDKFVLVESVSKCEISHADGSFEGQTPLGPSIQYKSAKVFLGEEIDSDSNDEENVSNTKRRKLETVSIPSDQGGLLQTENPQHENNAVGGSLLASSSTCITSTKSKPKDGDKGVAFISVKKPTLTRLAPEAVNVQGDESKNNHHVDKENPIFCFFNKENVKGSLL